MAPLIVISRGHMPAWVVKTLGPIETLSLEIFCHYAAYH